MTAIEPGPAPDAGSTGEHPSDRADRKPRWMSYAEVLGRPASAIIAALTVGFVSVIGQGLIQDQQSARVYTELLSQRELAESSIRKDMFETILGSFFSGAPADSGNTREQLLRLEMLALNFSETLSLSPLFRELDRKMNRQGAYVGFTSEVDRAQDLKRLRGLAKRVNGWQLSRLGVAGIAFEFSATMAEISDPAGYTFESLDLELEGVSRDYYITVSAPDPLQAVDVSITIESNEGGVAELRPTERSFTLSYYDFPLIDNTRLSHNQRFAVVLADFEPDEWVRIEAVVFPGAYATQRESPALRAVIEEIQGEGKRQTHVH